MPMRIAIAGCGAVAASHLRILKKIQPNARISLCDVDRRRAAELAARSAVSAVYASFDDLLRSEIPDAVHITTPPHAHAALAGAALQAGAHVLVEKPATETADEYRRLSALATAQGRTLACDYSTLGMPVVMKALREIRSRRLGRLIAVHCDFADSHRGNAIPYGDPSHWSYRLRGGVLQNMIDHPASLVLSVIDDIQDHRIFVTWRNVLPFDCPDLIAVTVRSQDQIGSFTLSLGHGAHERSAHFLLEGGTILVDMSRQLYSCTRGRGPQSFVAKTVAGVARGYAFAGGTLENAVRVATGRLQRDPGIANVVENFYRAVAGEADLLVPDRTVLAVATLLERIWMEVDYRPAQTLEAAGP